MSFVDYRKEVMYYCLFSYGFFSIAKYVQTVCVRFIQYNKAKSFMNEELSFNFG